jgi:hypothetical protein
LTSAPPRSARSGTGAPRESPPLSLLDNALYTAAFALLAVNPRVVDADFEPHRLDRREILADAINKHVEYWSPRCATTATLRPFAPNRAPSTPVRSRQRRAAYADGSTSADSRVSLCVETSVNDAIPPPGLSIARHVGASAQA